MKLPLTPEERHRLTQIRRQFGNGVKSWHGWSLNAMQNAYQKYLDYATRNRDTNVGAAKIEWP